MGGASACSPCSTAPARRTPFPEWPRRSPTPMLILPLGHQRDRAQVFPLFSSARTYASVTKWVETLNQAEQVSEVMRRAFNLLRMGRPGPVMVEIPADVAVAEVPEGALQYRPVKATCPAGEIGRAHV